MTGSAESRPTGYANREKWNELLFDNANKFHLHQDNLRWSLTAGFGAFFAAGVTLINQPTLAPTLARVLELLLLIAGTLWFLVVLVEGWYYNLAVAYLVCCEQAVSQRIDLIPLVDFDRSRVRSFHPSFAFVLLFMTSANAYHVFQCTYSYLHRTFPAWLLTLGYLSAMLLVIARGRVPQRLDATASHDPSPQSHAAWPASRPRKGGGKWANRFARISG